MFGIGDASKMKAAGLARNTSTDSLYIKKRSSYDDTYESLYDENGNLKKAASNTVKFRFHKITVIEFGSNGDKMLKSFNKEQDPDKLLKKMRE